MTTTVSATPSSAFRALAAACLALVGSAPALAQVQPPSMSAFVQLGRSPGGEHTNAATLGVTGPLLPGREFLGARLYWEAFLSQWRADDANGVRQSYNQLGLVPTARWQFGDGGRWFADAGIGLSYLDGAYNTPEHRFSTRWNFTERLALGRSFGAQNQHEVSLAVQHFSNGGAEKPNPGENFLSVRYAVRF